MSLFNILDFGVKLSALQPKIRLRLKQFGRLMLRVVKRLNVSGMIH